jgi:hypothetical protein
MATFYVIRFARTVSASELFGHIKPGVHGDYAIIEAGCYWGSGIDPSTFNVSFDKARFFTKAEAERRFANLAIDYPADVAAILPVQVEEPA